jgi:predicted dehydrogenase
MRPINRRDFLGAAAVGAVTGTVSGQQRRGATRPTPSGQARPKDPNRRLGLGLIGCGWYGMVDLKAALQVGGVNVLALCDVDSDHLNNSAAEVAKMQTAAPKTFKDYRQLLEVPGLDAVIIASPPHWHALQFIAACQKGLDIYCEKPLSYDLREGRAMVNAAERARNIVQVGFQRRNSMATTQAADYIRGGHAGRIVQVDAQINYAAKPLDTTIQAPPASLDWDAWCGPAPKLPYSPNIGHIAWRLEAAYGNGHLVDWGIHWIDSVRRVLGATVPKSVQAMGGIYELKGKISTPDVLTAFFEFEQCPVVWRHRLWGAAELEPSLSNSAVFYGEKETVLITDDRWAVYPPGKGDQKKVIQAQTPKMDVLHMANFLEAARTRQKPVCDTVDGYYSTATVQLAMISFQVGSRVSWDSLKEQVLENPAANRLLKRNYRAPYRHPADSFA